MSRFLNVFLLPIAVFCSCKESSSQSEEITPSFSFAFNSSNIQINRGEAKEFEINLSKIGEFNEDVTISIDTLGISGSTIIKRGSATGKITLVSKQDAQSGSVIFYATGGKIKSKTLISLSVSNIFAVTSLHSSIQDTLWEPVGNSIELTISAMDASGFLISKSILDLQGSTLLIEKTGIRSNSVYVTNISTTSDYKLKIDFMDLSSDSLNETPVIIKTMISGAQKNIYAIGLPKINGYSKVDFSVNGGPKNSFDITVVQNSRSLQINVPYMNSLNVNSKWAKNRLVTKKGGFYACTNKYPTSLTGTVPDNGQTYRASLETTLKVA